MLFCGAGVSMQSGLPNFSQLTQKVLEKIKATPEDNAKKLFDLTQKIEKEENIYGSFSFDYIFGQMHLSFPAHIIERAVSATIAPPKNPNYSAHKILLSLSKGHHGQVRIVTTNFDLLFEQADNNLTTYTRSNLPRIEHDGAEWGIVHIHGVVKPDYSGPTEDGFVLSSAEYGDAYLAHGWARNFVQQILDRYVAVFIGYSANDPPVRYLLEGLRQGGRSRIKAYAFEKGPSDQAIALWEEKGVHAVTYDVTTDGSHHRLWDSLEAWARQGADPFRWRRQLLTLAKKGPRALQPHERGMVAHLISTQSGALAFRNFNPALPAEWLCTFDPNIRFAEPRRRYLRSNDPVMDPFDCYGLDSDQRPTTVSNEEYSRKQRKPDDAWSGLDVNNADFSDINISVAVNFSGPHSYQPSELPDRLMNIAHWIGKVAHQPAAVWWAGHYNSLHPSVLDAIRLELSAIRRRKRRISKTILSAWDQIFEMSDIISNNYQNIARYSVDIIDWRNYNVRYYTSQFRSVLKPDSWMISSLPPFSTKQLALHDLVFISPSYDNDSLRIEIPDNRLADVLAQLRIALEHSADLEKRYNHERDLASIEEDEELQRDKNNRNFGLSEYFLYFVSLFKQLVEVSPNKAYAELTRWSRSDYAFRRVKIWALGNTKVAPPEEFAAELLSMNRDEFWPFRGQRDLMLGIANRWREFNLETRRAIERRILTGPRKYRSNSKEEQIRFASYHVLNRLHWLAAQGCGFTFDLESKTRKLQKSVPGWNVSEAHSAASSYDGTSGWVKTETDPSEIEHLPIDRIIHASRERSKREEVLVQYSPFDGLSKKRPVKALRSLLHAYSNGDFEGSFWDLFLGHDARKEDNIKITLLIARRILSIDNDDLSAVNRSLCSWFKKQGMNIRRTDDGVYLMIWNRIIELFRSGSMQSGLIRQGGIVDWAAEAINSGPGDLAQLLMNDPRVHHLGDGERFPLDWLNQISDLISVENDTRRYSLVIFCYNLSWFYLREREWTTKHLISVLNSSADDDQEAFWSGFFWGAKTPSVDLYKTLKPFLLDMIKSRPARKRHSEILSGILLSGWGSIDKVGARFVSNSEMQQVILASDDQFRDYTLWNLLRWIKEIEHWRNDLPVFLREVWPAHSKIRNPRISRYLFEIALNTQFKFAEVSLLVADLIAPISERYAFIKGLRDFPEELLRRHPGEVLQLLTAALPEDGMQWPYQADKLLQRLGQVSPKVRQDRKYIELMARIDDIGT